MSNLSRRKLVTVGVGAAVGASGLALGTRYAKSCGLIPPDHVGIYGAGNTLTYASHRLLTGESLAREFTRNQISTAPFAKLRAFKNANYSRMQEGGFLDWTVEVDGMVTQPAKFTLPELKSFPSSSQITQLACEEGWSFIAEWKGVPLSHILKLVETQPAARYVVYYSLQPNWWHSIDMADALHPQTLLVYGFNGTDLPMGHGGPVRLRVPRQLGYKNVKFITKLTVTDSLEKFKKGGNYSWYAGI